MEDYIKDEQPMEQQYNNYQQPVQGETLPNAVASMVLGILSIVLGCSPVGIILTICISIAIQKYFSNGSAKSITHRMRL